jgi:lipopolysaccharide/colanic/teichoic acid biosynthesis glycosyltransferase
MYQKYGKRCFDLMAAVAGAVLLLPVLLVVSVVVRCRLGSPILFKQPRAGRNGRIFVLQKFRSMTDARGADGALLPDAARLTLTGKFLRSTSLDELPQLFNVIRGEMALVGPRPLLVEYLSRYNAQQARRHEVRPGITGWAQVNGRNAISWEEKFALDVYYVDHVSLWLDFKILLLTVARVIRRGDVNQLGHPTMTPFMGSPPRTPHQEGT